MTTSANSPWNEDTKSPEEQREIAIGPSAEEERLQVFKEDDIDQRSKLHDLQARVTYTAYAKWTTIGWIVFVMALSTAQLAVRASGLQALDTIEFVAVVSTTTAAVFGLWSLVAKYLFPRN